MRIVDPYQSPRVLRAVLDDILDQVSKKIVGWKMIEHRQAEIEEGINMALMHMRFRGISILNLIAVSVTVKGFGVVSVHFKPMSEDGGWLLEQMDILRPLQEAKFNTAEERVEITRVLDL